jgi:hypothetical protein
MGMQRLPSKHKIKLKCPHCNRPFTYIGCKEDRFDYVMDVSDIRDLKCPLCLGEMELGGNMMLGYVTN